MIAVNAPSLLTSGHCDGFVASLATVDLTLRVSAAVPVAATGTSSNSAPSVSDQSPGAENSPEAPRAETSREVPGAETSVKSSSNVVPGVACIGDEGQGLSGKMKHDMTPQMPHRN